METTAESRRTEATAGPVLTPTRGESLYIWRKRRGLNQVRAARDLHVHPDLYRQWEADQGEDIPRKIVGKLKPHEVCTLLRRRAGKTQAALAEEMGLTRYWVVMMENGEGSIDRLLRYWGIDG